MTSKLKATLKLYTTSKMEITQKKKTTIAFVGEGVLYQFIM